MRCWQNGTRQIIPLNTTIISWIQPFFGDTLGPSEAICKSKNTKMINNDLPFHWARSHWRRCGIPSASTWWRCHWLWFSTRTSVSGIIKQKVMTYSASSLLGRSDSLSSPSSLLPVLLPLFMSLWWVHYINNRDNNWLTQKNQNQNVLGYRRWRQWNHRPHQSHSQNPGQHLSPWQLSKRLQPAEKEISGGVWELALRPISSSEEALNKNVNTTQP